MGRGSLCHASGGCPRRRRGDELPVFRGCAQGRGGAGEDGVFSCMGEGMAFYDMGTWDIESRPRSGGGSREGTASATCNMPMGKGPERPRPGSPPCSSVASKDVYERDKAFLSDIGEVFYLGDVKAACAFKLITNLIGLSNNVILTEGVFLAKRMGLSEEAFLNGAKSTGAWSYQMRNSGHKVFAEAFLPMRGTLDNAWKDMKFGVEMAEEAGVSCPAFAMLRDRYKAASEAGYGEEDYISVYRLLMDAENDGATAAEPCN